MRNLGRKHFGLSAPDCNGKPGVLEIMTLAQERATSGSSLSGVVELVLERGFGVKSGIRL